MTLPPPDDTWSIRPQGLPERASVGAVVLRRGGGGWCVAVVVEPGDYRQLPKGGLEPGETHEAALHRELREEAGLSRVRLVADLGERPLELGFRLEWSALNAVPPLFWPEQARLVERVRQNLERG